MSRRRPASAVLVDLLMGVMDSPSAWARAAGSDALGVAWRDAVTSEMIEAGRYVPYESLLARGATVAGVEGTAVAELLRAWATIDPWRDAVHLERARLPYAFVTNCSSRLAQLAARRSGLRPTFVLSAEEAGWYKPRSEIYRLACERIGAPAEEVAFVAGSPYDAAGARDAGLRAVLVRRRDDQEAPRRVRVVGSLGEAVEEVVAGRV